jgi:predicted dehydrogenase
MYPNPGKPFYKSHERILYEGTHILDLLCWLYESKPQRVVMTGDRYKNNCCILEFPEGSQAAFICGSMGSYCYWKEKMEIYAKYAVICVDDFVNMNVRGVPGEKDRLFAPYKNEHADEIMKYGFDFYEEYKVKEKLPYKDDYREQLGMVIEEVKRPAVPRPFDVSRYSQQNKEIPGFIPDKGWAKSLEHFAWCYLEGLEPENADGRAGATSSRIALKLLESLETGKTINFNQSKETVLSGQKQNENI